MSDPTIGQLQEQIRALEQQLLVAQKNSSLGELVGTTTHEFNNVLMTIINYARMGLRHRDDATRDKALTKILAAGERAAKITNSVLGMARNRSQDFAVVNLEELVGETMVLLEREMQKYRVAVEYEFGGVPPVHAIGNQIQQVLLNLLVNARQAMKNGGRLVIRTTSDPESNSVELTVRDYGCGMTPEQLQRIFEPYYTTKAGPDSSGKGGTGLGLHACHQIVQAHGGRIRVESTPGRGTAFTVRLRAAKRTASALPAVDLAAMTEAPRASR
jgi:signal transduction histidine kinase